jgi:ABC-type transport system involved in multi-copper enzyme maturation permease subunit
MNKISGVALNTFRESIREKLLYLVILYAGILLLSTYILSPLSIGAAKGKIVTDVGLAGISLLGVMTAIVVGSTMVHKEVDKKAVLMILTRPVSRPEYLLGKFAGMLLSVGALVGTMTAVLLVMMLLGGASITSAVFSAVYLAMVEIAVMCAIVIFFSTFTSPLLTTFFAICVFIAGNLGGDLRVFARKFGGPIMRYVMEIFYHILPNLKVFNLRHEAVHDLRFTAAEILYPTAYAAVYIAAMIYFSYLVFRRRDFS